MRRANIFIAIIVMASAAANVHADTITFVDGGVVEGRITIKNGKAHIELASGRGSLTIDELYVMRVEKKKTALDEFDERFAALQKAAPLSADDYVKLAQWAETQDLTLHARKAYQQALALDPNHETARKKLGFQLYEGKWLTQDEVNLAKGLLRYKGQWLTREQMGEIIKLELAAEQEKARALADRQAAARKKAEAELEKAKAAATEQQRLSNEYYDRTRDCGFGIYGGFCGGGYGYGYNTYGWPYYTFPRVYAPYQAQVYDHNPGRYGK